MIRKRKVCFDLIGRSSEEKQRIIERMEKVLEEEDNEGPQEPEKPSSINPDLTENPEEEQ